MRQLQQHHDRWPDVRASKGSRNLFSLFPRSVGSHGNSHENSIVRQTGTGLVDGGQYYNGIMFQQEPHYTDAGPQILNNIVSYTGGHGNGINIQGANNAVISGNNVSYWNHNGIDVKNATGVLVSGNTVHDQQIGAGLYVEFGDVTYKRNIVYNTHQGFQVGFNGQGKIYNNSLHNCRTGIYYGPNAVSLELKQRGQWFDNGARDRREHKLPGGLQQLGGETDVPDRPYDLQFFAMAGTGTAYS